MRRLLFYLCVVSFTFPACVNDETPKPPNILIAISDDQSWVHAGAYGCQFISTPAFDRLAREGVLFQNAIAPSPGCAPSRGALVTGRYPWQNERAGNHQSIWPERYKVLPDYLQEHGYHTGYTGKGVDPFFWSLGGRETNPAGEEYSLRQNDPPFEYISQIDYAANFEDFLEERREAQPFFFWYGAHEPHRRFQEGSGELAGKRKGTASVPTFLPEVDAVRTDLLDYANEIEWFDLHLGKIIRTLETIGELDNTIIIATADNGMAFPAAKANCREYGIHVPLVVRWGDRVTPNRVVDDLVSFVDVLPTLLEVAGIKLPEALPVSGTSFTNILYSDQQGIVDPGRKAVFSARERHSSSRYYNLAYPARAMRTQEYLLVWNCRPERWPAGAPKQLVDGQEVDAFKDVDWSPDHNLSMLYLMENQEDPRAAALAQNALAKRPEFELFDIKNDPGCTRNLADEPGMAEIKGQLISELMDYLERTGDPRVDPSRQHEFESHRRYAGIRDFPPADWTEQIAESELAEIKEWADRDTEPAVPPVAIGEWGVQTDRWKLVNGDGGWQLYDLSTDPETQNDLAEKKRKTVDNLHKYFRYWADRQ